MDGLRLQLFMARCDVGSRRLCEKIISSGRVYVNGKSITRLGTLVNPGDVVTLEGRILKPVTRRLYIALHKPSRYLCSNSDKQGRPLAKDLFGDAVNVRVFHVGRLDFLSSGLILYTNDGEFSRIVSHPSSEIPKRYVVESTRDVPEQVLRDFKKGLNIEGQRYRLHRYRRIGKQKVLLTLVEGKNREIRRVLEAAGVQIKRVHRTEIGSVSIRGLRPGQFRFLKKEEIDWFMGLRH
jgi:23S rRNA pseudouridine2605 synthase